MHTPFVLALIRSPFVLALIHTPFVLALHSFHPRYYDYLPTYNIYIYSYAFLVGLDLMTNTPLYQLLRAPLSWSFTLPSFAPSDRFVLNVHTSLC